MTGAWDQPAQRTTRLLSGRVLFGLALALLVKAHLGLDPGTVFTEGLSQITGLTMGTVTVVISVALWRYGSRCANVRSGVHRQCPAARTVLDLALALIPTPHALAPRVLFLITAIPATIPDVAARCRPGLPLGPGSPSRPSRDG